ncbi:hypothetical protein BPC006_II2513 [Burkholderia pseudomallei BPC006]|nr:hypothetical protein BPC006_II2513 [Burkholderia pseudomallei BPC006]EDO89359.1 hypothetical protein BURPSPAST_AC0370 [Burkholderia pseudomallei Pasteur 52237]
MPRPRPTVRAALSDARAGLRRARAFFLRQTKATASDANPPRRCAAMRGATRCGRRATARRRRERSSIVGDRRKSRFGALE